MGKVLLGKVLIEQRETVKAADGNSLPLIGVDNKIGLHLSRQKRLSDLSRYKLLKRKWFAYNPMRINVGSIGYANSDDKTGIISPDYVVFSCSNLIHPEYFFHFIKSESGLREIAKNTNGSVRERLYFQNLAKIEIELPSIEKQQEIVNKIFHIKKEYISLQEEISLQISDLKFLRQSILQEAIQGKLVPQDPTDEPASDLFERINKKRQDINGKRQPKKEKQLSVNEIPFKLPDSWEWSQLSKVGTINPRNSSANGSDNAAFIPMKNISASFNVAPIIQETKWEEIKSGFTHFSNNDVAIAKITPCFENSKAAIFQNLPNGIGAGTTELHVFRCSEGIEPGFVYLFFKSDYFLKLGESKMTGSAGQKRVPTDFVKLVWFPIPPFKEQQRIVTKVNQLMRLCEEMEQQFTQSKTDAEQLLQVVLREAFEGKLTVPKHTSKQDQVFWQKQLLAAYINMLMEQHQEQGEMAIAKYTYLNDRINNPCSGFRYVPHNFGPYSPEIKDCLTAPDAPFCKKTVGKKGYEVYHVNKELEADFIDPKNGALQEAQKGFRQLMQVFSVFPMQERARQLELVASICWLIEQKQTIDIDTLYNGLENWPTPKRRVQHKGQLFTKAETATGLQLIQQQGWHIKLLR